MMKRTNILKIAIVPMVLFTVMAFTNLPAQKDKESKGNKSQGKSEDNGQPSKEEKSQSAGNKNDGVDRQVQDNNGHGNKPERRNRDDNQGNADKMNRNDNASHGNMDHGNSNSRKMNGKRDGDIDWNLSNFAERKHPKDQKKVSICHKPSEDGENNGVTISVSENALKAHMSHGDQMGNCTINYSDRWSSNYVKARENVYNTYEQTYERMSYSEALLRLAADKILGIKSNLDRNRTTLSSSEIQRREALIYELQNNMNALDSQVGVTRQRLDSDVNIIIKL